MGTRGRVLAVVIIAVIAIAGLLIGLGVAARGAGRQDDAALVPKGPERTPCDPTLQTVSYAEQKRMLATRQCAHVYLDKYARSLHLRIRGGAFDGKYVGVAAGAAGAAGEVRAVDAASAAECRFVKAGKNAVDYLISVDGSNASVSAEGAVVATGGSKVSSFVVTGVPGNPVIAVHGVAVDATGALRTGPGAVTMAVLDGGILANGIYLTRGATAEYDEYSARADKINAVKASCCSLYRDKCADPKHSALKPLCCTPCLDERDECGDLVQYDAWPFATKLSCCASVADLGIRRSYGDTACIAEKTECSGSARVEKTKLPQIGAYVPSFGKIAVERSLCDSLYFL
jgi:hypothetical protein